MPKKFRSDQEWMDIILTCRKSGLSDYHWCKENGVAASTFYRYIKKFRMQGRPQISAITPVPDSHEVVQVSLSKEPSSYIDDNTLHAADSPAIRLHINRICMEIHNHADSQLLTNTLLALKDIC